MNRKNKTNIYYYDNNYTIKLINQLEFWLTQDLWGGGEEGADSRGTLIWYNGLVRGRLLGKGRFDEEIR